MASELVAILCILSCMFGILVGRTFFPRTIQNRLDDTERADWWKRGEDPPEYE